MGDSGEKLDVEEAIIRLNDALKLQYRSAHQYMLSSMIRTSGCSLLYSSNHLE
jgi:hypothetical protein